MKSLWEILGWNIPNMVFPLTSTGGLIVSLRRDIPNEFTGDSLSTCPRFTSTVSTSKKTESVLLSLGDHKWN